MTKKDEFDLEYTLVRQDGNLEQNSIALLENWRMSSYPLSQLNVRALSRFCGLALFRGRARVLSDSVCGGDLNTTAVKFRESFKALKRQKKWAK